MAATTQKKRTWMGLVCPICRFVFRVPRGHQGQGVACPACKYLLNLPSEEKHPISTPRQPDEAKALIPVPRGSQEETAGQKPILARAMTDEDRAVPDSETTPAREYKPSASQPAGKSSSKGQVRRKKRSRPQQEHSWDSDASTAPSQPRASSSNSSKLPVLLGSLALLSLLAVAAFGVYQWSKKSKTTGVEKTQEWQQVFTDDKKLDEEELTDEEKRIQKEITDSVTTGVNVLEKSGEVVRAFLAAETPEEMIKYVRTPEVTGPRIKAWYAERGYKVTEAKDVGYGGRITVKGKMASLAVRLGDYSVKQIALERIGSEYKVDWESWVIWTSHPWDKLFTDKPTKPVTVRAIAIVDTYYNRQFNDEQKWRALRLQYTPEHRSLYAYIDKNDPLLTRLVSDVGHGRGRAVTIDIKYPENAASNNQVIVTKYHQNGWVRSPKDTEDELERAEPESNQ